MVNNPSHYGGKDNPYEAIKVIDAWELGFCLGNTVKYISRCGKKFTDKTIEDLQKAAWYLNHEIELLKLNKQNKQATMEKACEELRFYIRTMLNPMDFSIGMGKYAIQVYIYNSFSTAHLKEEIMGFPIIWKSNVGRPMASGDKNAI